MTDTERELLLKLAELLVPEEPDPYSWELSSIYCHAKQVEAEAAEEAWRQELLS